MAFGIDTNKIKNSVDELNKNLKENFDAIESNQNDHMKALVSIYANQVTINKNLQLINSKCEDLPLPKINMEDEDSNEVKIK